MGKTLIVGLGNPILGDDGVGWRVAEAVQQQIDTASPGKTAGTTESIEVDYCALGGLSLMERLIGYDCAIVIDAVATGQPPGTVTGCWHDELQDRFSLHTRSAHDASLHMALQLGRRLNAHLPRHVWIVGIESPLTYDFSDCLSPAVAAAVPQAVAAVLKTLTELTVQEESNGLA